MLLLSATCTVVYAHTTYPKTEMVSLDFDREAFYIFRDVHDIRICFFLNSINSNEATFKLLF